jgi:hypothetical protein
MPHFHHGDIMNKRDKNFKLSKQSKTILALATHPSKRSFYRNIMIDAEIVASTPFKSSKPRDAE